MSRFLFVILFFSSSILGSSFTGEIVRISITNNHRTSTEKIFSNLSSRVHAPFSINSINKDIHMLMKSGQFDNIIVFAQQLSNGVELLYNVEEAPEVKKITIDDEQSEIWISKKNLQTKINTPFNNYKWKKDLENLELHFLKNYYYDVKITDEVLISKSLNFVSIFVKIVSGTPQYVEDIIISGNNAVLDSEIEEIVHFRPKGGWLWWKEKGIFFPSKFPEDLEKIQNLYKQKGYLDTTASITKTKGSNPNAMVLNINIKEGPQYGVEKFLWQQNFLSSNNFEILKEEFALPENAAYYPFAEKGIKEKIKNVFEEINLPQPEVTIREFTSPKSSPGNPRLDIGISLKSSRNN